ncbi:restriction endonuclease subunit S [Sebaldella sp. S0638]|uniref:restriction endonuclease subunit S n=1 Tax=Sebaldella sp. S0638 TaxID=2957809 RepID=UPI00209DB604|nr:restriction endonuclease subunit S [Sebaldella sp. S0638]MCP1226162.1 restriction endonuclease subunit S [Sebaldella sp. S0638]
MKMIKLPELFDFYRGNDFELINMKQDDNSKINFISRTGSNNGVAARVKVVEGVEPFEKGLITVALGGSVLSTFVQKRDFYTGFHVMVLKPKKEMSFLEKQFYALCIEKNKYRYNYGRQANKTLKSLEIPEKIPDWAQKNLNIKQLKKRKKEKIVLETGKWKEYKLSDFFTIKSSKDEFSSSYLPGSIPYITSTAYNNGVTSYVSSSEVNEGNVITINRGGSVGCAFYQEYNFLATKVDVRILSMKKPYILNKYIALFLTTILGKEKYRFNYSRKMGTNRLRELTIKLPTLNDKPDWEFMENYIKSLPYSENI